VVPLNDELEIEQDGNKVEGDHAGSSGDSGAHLKDVIRATVDESLIEVSDSPIESIDCVPNTPDQIAPDVPQAGNQNEKAFDEQDARLDGSTQSWLQKFKFSLLLI
jgi:hypothetical protein